MKIDVNEDIIAAQVRALEPLISDAMRRGINCHFRIGETLNAIRGQLLRIRGAASESLASFIPPVAIGCLDRTPSTSCSRATQCGGFDRWLPWAWRGVLPALRLMRKVARGSVDSLDSPLVPFDAHFIVCGNLAKTDEAVVGWMAGVLEHNQILDYGFAVRGLEFPQALWILSLQCAEHVTIMANLIAAERVHGSIPSDVRQEQSGGCRTLSIQRPVVYFQPENGRTLLW